MPRTAQKATILGESRGLEVCDDNHYSQLQLTHNKKYLCRTLPSGQHFEGGLLLYYS